MNTVRPNPFPAAPVRPAGPAPADAAKLAAARAFFQMAAGQPAAAASPGAAAASFQAAAPVREAPRAQRLPQAGAEAPAKVLRPGSLLDIRV